MPPTAHPATLNDVRPWRDLYRLEMACQITHDSIHSRDGWTHEFLLRDDSGTSVGYGSVAVAGPWKDRPTIYEFFVSPPHRCRMFDLFDALLSASAAVAIETQSNDPLLTVMLHAHGRGVE